MTFLKAGFSISTPAQNTPTPANNITGIPSPRTNTTCQTATYFTATDTMATTLAADYFVSECKGLRIGDLIDIVATDGHLLASVTFVNTGGDGNQYVDPVVDATPASVLIAPVSGQIMSASTTIATAAILTLDGTPVAISPVFPTGYTGILLGAAVTNRFNTTAFATTGGTLLVQYLSGTPTASTAFPEALIEAVASSTAVALPVAVATTATATLLAHNRFVLSASAAITTGNGAFGVDIAYVLIAIP